eukprot:scaffold187034_cov36-Prasinocladus_malaysianus.AAC.1
MFAICLKRALWESNALDGQHGAMRNLKSESYDCGPAVATSDVKEGQRAQVHRLLELPTDS